MIIENRSLDSFSCGNKYDSFAYRQLDEEMIECLSQVGRNSFFQVVILREGSGESMIDFKHTVLTSGSICFIFPHQIASIKFPEGAVGEMLMFDDTIFCSQILSNELKEYNIDLQQKINVVHYGENMAQFQSITSVVEIIKGLETPYNNIRKIEVKFLTKILIFKILDSVPNTASLFQGMKDVELKCYIEFRRLVDDYFRDNRKVEYYCSKLGITAKKLNILCKRYSNSTALDLIHMRLTLEIKRIFIYEHISLKEVAFTLGFDSQSALNKYIASKFNSTPSELKDRIQGSL